jgi:hypothetical protein
MRALVSAFDDPSDLKRCPILLPRSRILFMYIDTFPNNRSSLPKQIDHFSMQLYFENGRYVQASTDSTVRMFLHALYVYQRLDRTETQSG